MNALAGARCVGMHWLFESTDERDHIAARNICAECPALRACAELLRDVQTATAGTRHAGGGPTGTWAGKLISKKGVKSVRAECGTDSGYFRHRRYGEAACESCRLAHNAEENRRRRSRVRS